MKEQSEQRAMGTTRDGVCPPRVHRARRHAGSEQAAQSQDAGSLRVLGTQGMALAGLAVAIAQQVHAVALPGTIELSSLNGTNGFKSNGISANDFSGFAVSDAGDVNGD